MNRGAVSAVSGRTVRKKYSSGKIQSCGAKGCSMQVQLSLWRCGLPLFLSLGL